MPEPLFDRYGEWPTEPLAMPDPGAPRAAATSLVPSHTGMGTTMVLSTNDALEIERQELGL